MMMFYDRPFFFIVYFNKELFESLDEKLDDDLLEALAAFSLPKAQYDARTLNLAMKVGPSVIT